MGMHGVFVVIEGNHLSEISEVLEKRGYVVEKSFTVKTGKQASREMTWKPDGQHVAKAAYFANDWTFILDPELVLFADDVWLEFSNKWKSRIVNFMCEDTSATYGLSFFKSGKKSRFVVSSDGNLAVSEGKPVAEESGADWTEATDDTIWKIMESFGAKYDFLQPDRPCHIFRLRETS